MFSRSVEYWYSSHFHPRCSTLVPTFNMYRACAKDLPIGNAQILNSESGDDLLQQTKITPHQYRYDGHMLIYICCVQKQLHGMMKLLMSDSGMRSIVLTVFYISYSLCEVPSNYFLKFFGPNVRNMNPLLSRGSEILTYIISCHC